MREHLYIVVKLITDLGVEHSNRLPARYHSA
jgi:hypothetical protein